MKLTKKQIEMIRANTPDEIKGKQVSSINEAYGDTLGYYQPSQANWAYTAQYITYKGAKYLVVTRFGEIM